MTYPGGVDPHFISITRAPTEGRDTRRRYIRHRVMLNYHKQKRNRLTCSYDEPELPVELQLIRTSSQKGKSSTVDSLDSTASTVLADATATPIIRPPESLVLLKPKIWTDIGHQQASQIIFRFLCGQVQKGIQDLSCLVFVHHRVLRSVDIASNPLSEYQAILEKHSPAVMQDESLWRKVYLAQEGLYTRRDTFSKWQLLSAVQTMTLFIFLRLSYGSNHAAFPDADIALLFSLGTIFKLLQERYLNIAELGHTSNSLHDDWEDWIFKESTMRTAMVYFLLTLIVSVDFGLGCTRPDDWCLEEMPLPGSKTLWEARDQTAWGDAVVTTRSGTEVLTLGDLIHMQEGLHRTQIGIWQEDMDELGLLVTIASCLAPR